MPKTPLQLWEAFVQGFPNKNPEALSVLKSAYLAGAYAMYQEVTIKVPQLPEAAGMLYLADCEAEIRELYTHIKAGGDI